MGRVDVVITQRVGRVVDSGVETRVTTIVASFIRAKRALLITVKKINILFCMCVSFIVFPDKQ